MVGQLWSVSSHEGVEGTFSALQIIFCAVERSADNILYCGKKLMEMVFAECIDFRFRES